MLLSIKKQSKSIKQYSKQKDMTISDSISHLDRGLILGSRIYIEPPSQYNKMPSWLIALDDCHSLRRSPAISTTHTLLIFLKMSSYQRNWHTHHSGTLF